SRTRAVSPSLIRVVVPEKAIVQGELEVLSVGLVVGLCLGRSRAGGRASRCRCSRRSGRCGPGRGLVTGPGMAWFPCHSWSGGVPLCFSSRGKGQIPQEYSVGLGCQGRSVRELPPRLNWNFASVRFRQLWPPRVCGSKRHRTAARTARRSASSPRRSVLDYVSY